jgi:succinate dehydrogenase / fumarate reductase iron-sulfur subunit
VIGESLKHLEAWIETDSYDANGHDPEITQEAAAKAREYSRCIHCGICIEVCPSVSGISEYKGPIAIAACAAYLEMNLPEADSIRLQQVLMQPGGAVDCGNAFNCVQLCPQKIPLTSAIAVTNRRINATVWKSLRDR